MNLTLASTSPFRKELLQRLGLYFVTAKPDVEESRQDNESAVDMARRLAEAKARDVANRMKEGLVIGSDQTVDCDGTILGKPLGFDKAREQLLAMSGRTLIFHTGLCVINVARDRAYSEVVDYHVTFRQLDEPEIERYLKHEQPYQCAGSFKSEALGIALLEKMRGDDPTALIGLPLIRLSEILRNEGLAVP